MGTRRSTDAFTGVDPHRLGSVDNRNGRLPREIYIRRRVAAIVVLLIVVFLVVWLISALIGGGEDPEPTAEETTAGTSSTLPVSTSSLTTTTSAEGSATASTGAQSTGASENEKPYGGSETTTAGTTKPSVPEPKKTCELNDLIVSATTDQAAYAPNAEPSFYMTVENPTAADCVIDLGKDVLRFEVYDLATNRRVWSDVDCNPAVDVTERTFPAGEERYYEAIWSRTNSAPGSCSNRVEVPAGGYYLHTLVGNNHSDAHPFNLR